MSKKIIFLVKSDKTPSSRIRIRDLIPYLEDMGFEIEVENIPKSFFARLKLFKKCKSFDLTIFQKRLFSKIEFALLRKNARKLAFDFDDAVFFHNASPSGHDSDYISPTRRRRFARILRNCDFGIAANNYLSDEALKLVPEASVHIIPSSVYYEEKVSENDYKLSSPPVIGWVGTKVNQKYIELIAPQLCELRKKKDFVLHVISDLELSISGIEINNIPWSLENETEEILKFDIGIMPLSSDPYSEGKSSYKLLQYMAAGVPSVASAVGMNRDVAGNDEFAMLADSGEEFLEKILKLMDDEKLRQSIGNKAKLKIEKEFSRKAVGAKFADLMQKKLQI